MEALIREAFGESLVSADYAKAGRDSDLCRTCGETHPNIKNDTCDRLTPEIDEADVDQAAPPGRERLVKALKRQKSVDNPWAVAWAIHNKNRQ